MNRLLGALVLGLVFTATGYAQDSGPGPVDPNTLQEYDVNLFQRSATATGVFTFHAATDATTAHTTGDFDATIDADTYTGTYHAYDLGEYSFWVAQGEGDANNLSALGWATPDIVVGRASVTANSSGGGWWFWRLLSRKSYWFYGTVVEQPAPVEPMEPTGT